MKQKDVQTDRKLICRKVLEKLVQVGEHGRRSLSEGIHASRLYVNTGAVANMRNSYKHYIGYERLKSLGPVLQRLNTTEDLIVELETGPKISSQPDHIPHSFQPECDRSLEMMLMGLVWVLIYT